MKKIDKDFLLKDSKTFCMFPWLHLFVTPKGDAFPCCSHSNQPPLGNVKKESMIKIFNSTDLKKLRIDMINNTPNKICNYCYDFEKSGTSLRTYSREMFATHFDDIVYKTEEDGTVPEFKMRYLDIRFSNICNFKCRTCGSLYSSQWAIEDFQKNKNNNIGNKYTILKADETENLLKETLDHLDHVDMVYFAGGEPLITEEHYIILEEMIKLGRNNILLRYNSNASTLKYKNKDLLNLWKYFDKIEFSASIDHYGERAEWLRHGTNWGEVESNLKIFRNLKNVNFQINTVLSIFNYVTLVDFYNYLIKNDLYRTTDFYHFLVATSDPVYYSSAALPEQLKKKGTRKILNYSKKIEIEQNHSLIRNLDTALKHTNSQNIWHEHEKEFKEKVLEIDKIRGEDMTKVFPELTSLFD